MKVTDFKQEIIALSTTDLQVRLEELQRALFSLRLHASTQPLKDTNQFKMLRRNIARVQTRLQQVS